MSDTETASWIAALERARTELETALSVDAPWQAPRGAAGDADWAGYETALAGNPVYRCWAQLSEAIEHLRRQAQAQSQAEAPAGRRRVSLRDVLDHIRSDPALLEGAETGAAAAPADRGGPGGTIRSRAAGQRAARGNRSRPAGAGGGDSLVRDPRAGAAGACGRNRRRGIHAETADSAGGAVPGARAGARSRRGSRGRHRSAVAVIRIASVRAGAIVAMQYGAA